MKPSTLRQLWSVIEETQTNIFLRFSDAELIQQLLEQMTHRTRLSPEEIQAVSTYIHSRIPLIRTLAQARPAWRQSNH